MTTLQVHHAPSPLDAITQNLSDAISLPDPEAAVSLNERMSVWVRIDKLQERSFVERGLIIREFEKRQLWKHLIDPETDQPYPHLTAWLSSDGFLGCRRTNFEAKRTLAMLEDVPAAKLIDISKATLHTLTQLSTAVRNDDAVLEAARTLKPEEFLEKMEVEHPQQHVEARKPLKFNPGRSGVKVVEEAITWALEHDIAGSRDEALVRMAETALNDWELEEELKNMPAEEVPA
jgi:hypothetical protein